MIEAYIKKHSYSKNEDIKLYINTDNKKIISLRIFEYKNPNNILYENQFIQKPQLENSKVINRFAIGYNWTVSHIFNASQIPNYGLFIIKLYNNNKFCFIPFIKKNPNPNNIVVIVNTNTWCAYNDYGGGSFYVYTNNYKSKYAKNVSSFNKPNMIISNEINRYINNQKDARSHLFVGESFLWDWLYKYNYKFDFITDIDVESIENLQKRKIIFLNCHPEYWTHKMYYNLYKIIDNTPTNLCNLSGNTIWRKILINKKNRIERIGQPFCNSVLNAYRSKYSIDNFARYNRLISPPYKILGVFYDKRGYNTYSLFKVINSNNWLLEGTNLKNGNIIGNKYIGLKPSGHETDKINHLYLLKKNITSSSIIHIAKGKNEKSGGADICYFIHKKAKVFSAGSITFTRCLIDNNVTIMLKNVMKKFLY